MLVCAREGPYLALRALSSPPPPPGAAKTVTALSSLVATITYFPSAVVKIFEMELLADAVPSRGCCCCCFCSTLRFFLLGVVSSSSAAAATADWSAVHDDSKVPAATDADASKTCRTFEAAV